MRRFVLFLVAALTTLHAMPQASFGQSGAPTREFVSLTSTVATRPGTQLRTVIWRATPTADSAGVAVLLFAGGNGLVRIAGNGAIGGLTQNFLVRSRSSFIDAGVDFVATVDAPSDRAQGMTGTFRLSRTHADDVAIVIDNLRSRSRLPVWLVGVSAGTLSVANLAARLATSSTEIGGIVLASPMSQLDKDGKCGKTVFDANISSFRGPVLVLAHAADGCACTPAAKVDEILKGFVLSAKKESKIFEGGSPPVSAACEARSQHGFYGIEDEVVRYAVAWMKAAR